MKIKIKTGEFNQIEINRVMAAFATDRAKHLPTPCVNIFLIDKFEETIENTVDTTVDALMLCSLLALMLHYSPHVNTTYSILRAIIAALD